MLFINHALARKITIPKSFYFLPKLNISLQYQKVNMGINKILISEHEEFRLIKCDLCDQEYDTMKKLSDHSQAEHLVPESIDSPLTWYCGENDRDGICRISFGSEANLALHKGIRHFDTSNHYCPECHAGKYYNIGYTV